MNQREILASLERVGWFDQFPDSERAREAYEAWLKESEPDGAIPCITTEVGVYGDGAYSELVERISEVAFGLAPLRAVSDEVVDGRATIETILHDGRMLSGEWEQQSDYTSPDFVSYLKRLAGCFELSLVEIENEYFVLARPEFLDRVSEILPTHSRGSTDPGELDVAERFVPGESKTSAYDVTSISPVSRPVATEMLAPSAPERLWETKLSKSANARVLAGPEVAYAPLAQGRMASVLKSDGEEQECGLQDVGPTTRSVCLGNNLAVLIGSGELRVYIGGPSGLGGLAPVSDLPRGAFDGTVVAREGLVSWPRLELTPFRELLLVGGVVCGRRYFGLVRSTDGVKRMGVFDLVSERCEREFLDTSLRFEVASSTLAFARSKGMSYVLDTRTLEFLEVVAESPLHASAISNRAVIKWCQRKVLSYSLGGALLWEAPATNAYSFAVFADAVVSTEYGGDTVVCRDSMSGDIRWTCNVPKRKGNPYLSVSPTGMIFRAVGRWIDAIGDPMA